MVIAGETSGDTLAADLVRALRREVPRVQNESRPEPQPLTTGLEAEFFGAGGPEMAAAGVEVAVDWTAHAVVGLTDVLKNLPRIKRIFNQLLSLAVERAPDAIIFVDFSGFNLRFAQAIKKRVRARKGPFNNWDPKLIYYVSPQVWASRPGRARLMERDLDLVLSLFPFEKEWYAKRAPGLRVEFVGHPILDRFQECGTAVPWEERGHDLSALSPVPLVDHAGEKARAAPREISKVQWPMESALPLVLLLPGSRTGELKRHLPLVLAAARELDKAMKLRFRMIVPNENLARLAERSLEEKPVIEIKTGGLAASLRETTVAMASTGTVTLECAFFGVPAVAFYRTSWITYQVGRRMVRVKHLAMPNILGNEMIYPELIQHSATAENLCGETLALLQDPLRREKIRYKLGRIMESLGRPGASQRAARIIAESIARPAPDQ
jgi:lipid-A-disaccharide synthase